MADKNLEEAKRLNKQTTQGNISNISSSAGAREAQQYNAASGNFSSTTGANSATQQARQLNAQSAGKGGFTNLAGSSALAEAKKANRQSSQNKKP